MRAALGATRWRLARQLLIESVVLAGAGGALGVGLAYGAVAALGRFGPADMPRLADDRRRRAGARLRPVGDGRSARCCSVSRRRCGSRGTGMGETLKQGGRAIAGSRHQRTRRALAAVEVALAFVLVVSSGLLLRSFMSMVDARSRIPARGRHHGVRRACRSRGTTRTRAAAFFTRAAERVRALPGVREAAFSSDLPWTGYDENTGFAIVGRQFPDGEGPEARYHFITTGYTRATGTPLVAGRDLVAVGREGRAARACS